jgi:hypothetical protein
MRTQSDHDLRSLALHRIVVQKMQRDPALSMSALALVRRWKCKATPGVMVYLEAWEKVLLQGLDACREAALQQNEWGNSLRQSSPLPCLLTNAERFTFLKSWREGEYATQ